MKNYDEVVLECYAKVLVEMGKDIIPSLDVEIGRESGLDSLGLVNLMFEIEEALDINLESVLIGIRQSHTLREIVVLVQEVVEVSENDIN